MIKIKHPAPFNNTLDNSLVLVYAETNGIRYNIAPKDAPEDDEGCAAVLTQWIPNIYYSNLYRETSIKTINPQPID